MMIEQPWVWFDMDDTLHDFSTPASRATKETLAFLSDEGHLDIEQVKIGYHLIIDEHRKIRFADGRAPHEYRRERFIGALKGTSLSPQAQEDVLEKALALFDRVFMENLHLKPLVKEMLETLKTQGKKLAIVSDAPEQAQRRVTAVLGIDHYFEDIITAGAYGVSKRDGLFEKALERFNLVPQDVFMIGDAPHIDIEPAMALGIEALWYNDKKVKTNAHLPAITSYKALMTQKTLY